LLDEDGSTRVPPLVVMYLLLELDPGGMIMTFVKAYPRAVAGRGIVFAPAARVNFPGGAEVVDDGWVCCESCR